MLSDTPRFHVRATHQHPPARTHADANAHIRRCGCCARGEPTGSARRSRRPSLATTAATTRPASPSSRTATARWPIAPPSLPPSPSHPPPPPPNLPPSSHVLCVTLLAPLPASPPRLSGCGAATAHHHRHRAQYVLDSVWCGNYDGSSAVMRKEARPLLVLLQVVIPPSLPPATSTSFAWHGTLVAQGRCTPVASLCTWPLPPPPPPPPAPGAAGALAADAGPLLLFFAVRRPARLDAAGASAWGGGAMEEEDWDDELWDDDCFDEKLEQLRVNRRRHGCNRRTGITTLQLTGSPSLLRSIRAKSAADLTRATVASPNGVAGRRARGVDGAVCLLLDPARQAVHAYPRIPRLHLAAGAAPPPFRHVSTWVVNHQPNPN